LPPPFRSGVEYVRVSLVTLPILLFPAAALAAVSPLDQEGYRAIDSLAPEPLLAAALVPLLTGSSDSGEFTGLEDDQSHYLDLSSWGDTGVYDYFGGQVRVHTNGFVTSSSTSAYFNNGPFPDSRFSSRQIIAPFWDDLTPVEGESTLTWSVQDSQFVVLEWTDFTRYGEPTARLSFRVTLALDGTGWVLFQYTKLEGPGADGSSATIGIQGRYQKAYITYSVDLPAALPTGTAAPGTTLHEILFDLDWDNDQLPRGLEMLLGSDDSHFDSDTGGVSDVTEYVNGTVLSDPSDDVGTDTDTDGLSDLDEVFFGSDPTLTDTDGDTLSDYDEVTSIGTNPAAADTDGDGVDDNVEIDGHRDPLDPLDFPLVEFHVSSSTKHKVRAVTCDDGNVHVIAFDDSDEDGLFYYVLDTAGASVIAETRFAVGHEVVKHTDISCWGDTTYLTYDLVASVAGGGPRGLSESEGLIGVIAVRASLDDRDGDAADPASITAWDTLISLPDNPRHHAAVASADGLHIVFEKQLESPWPDSQGGAETVGYVRVSTTGTVGDEVQIAEFPQKNGDGDIAFGIHKNHTPRVAVDATGVAHVVFSAQSAPYYQSDDPVQFPSGLWYAAISGTTVEGPHYLGHGRLERIDVDLVGSLLYIFASAGYDTDNGFYKSQGVRQGVLDISNYSVIPRVGSEFEWDTTAVAPMSMILPIQPVYLNNESMQGATVLVLDNGVAINAYTTDWDDHFCLLAVGIDGSALGAEACYFSGESTHNTRHKGLVDLGDGLGFVFNDRSQAMYFARIDYTTLFDPNNVPALPEKVAPEIVSTAPDFTVIGEQYTYRARAVDADRDIDAFSLVSGPAGDLAVTPDGLVTWNATLEDDPTVTIEIKVADQTGLEGTQEFTVRVYGLEEGDDDDATDDDDAADDDDSGDTDTDGCDDCSQAGARSAAPWGLLLLLPAMARRRRSV
jgi:hypothetical protein